MDSHPGHLVVVLTWLAVVTHGLPAQAREAPARGGDEPIAYAAVPEFWAEIERLLHSGLEFHRTNHGVIGAAPGEREKILQANRAALHRLKGVSLPQIGDFRRVRVFSTPTFPQFSLLGYLVCEEPGAWTIFSSRWRIERVARVKHTRIEPSVVNAEIDAALKMAAVVQADRGRTAYQPIEAPAALKDGHNHFNRRFLLFDAAYLAFATGRHEAVEPLLRAAFYQHAEMLVELYDELAWRQFESAVLDLNQGARRAILAKRFQRIADEFPEGRYLEQATDYARKLKQMALEEPEGTPPKARSTTDDLVKSLIYQLRECDAAQHMQPGACWIPGVFQPVEGPGANAADLLILEGFDAVPALIEALEDSRLTRSYGFDRDFAPWRYVLEVRDAAVQSLVVLADERFSGRIYHPNSTGRYFSNDTPEARAAAVARVRRWWDEAQAMGEAAWLRSRLPHAGQSRPMLLRRLVRVEHRKALPDVRKWLAEEKHNRTYSYQLLLRAGGAEAIDEVRAAADPEVMPFEFAALFALNREGHLKREEYQSALLRASEKIAAFEPEKVPPQVLSALIETGDRECALLVAQRLRGGRPNFDRSMRWALARIDEPAIAAEVAAYLLPLFDDAKTATNSGWRNYFEGERDIYRVKDDAAFLVNKLLDRPLPNFADLTPPERDAEIEKLRKICTARGIRPAFALRPSP